MRSPGRRSSRSCRRSRAWTVTTSPSSGFPIIAFGPEKGAREFLEAKAAGKKVALFITHAAPEDQEGVGEWLDKCRDAASGTDLAGMFDCQGELAEGIAGLLLKSDDEMMRSFGERRPETMGQPDESRLEKARAFAQEILQTAGE